MLCTFDTWQAVTLMGLTNSTMTHDHIAVAAEDTFHTCRTCNICQCCLTNTLETHRLRVFATLHTVHTQ